MCCVQNLDKEIILATRHSVLLCTYACQVLKKVLDNSNDLFKKKLLA